MLHTADNLAARLGDDVRGVALQFLAECVVGREEEPAIEAALHRGEAGDAGQRVGVVGVVDDVGTARLVGQPDRAGTIEHDDLAARPGHFRRSQRRGGASHIDDGLDTLVVEHLTGEIRGQIGLVEMVGDHDLDLAPENLAAEILNGHLGCGLAARPRNVGKQAGHVEDGAQFQRRGALCHGSREW